MVALSGRTREHLAALFSATDRDIAEQLLLDWSSDRRGAPVATTPESWERLWFSAIRLSRGDIEELKRAIDVGRQDWRDLLVAADFADDVHAHERWIARKVTNEILQAWRTGQHISGVRFGLNDSVEVYGGDHPAGTRGSVLSLVDFEPEPQYLVETHAGNCIRVRQSWLRKSR